MKPIMKIYRSMLVLLLFTGWTGMAMGQDLPSFGSADAPQPNPGAPMYRETGEQYRIYEFPGTGEPIPYRLFVPENWTPGQSLPILVTLRAGNSINNNHRQNNDLVQEARERGYIVISPLGYRGYSQPYYNSPYPADRANGPSTPGAGWTDEEDLRAEMDVLYVLGLVGAEYGADMSRVFIHGQNPSGSAAFNFGAKYPDVFSGLIVSAGAIVTDGYPFGNLAGNVSVMLLQGDQDRAYTIETEQALAQTLRDNGVEAEFHLVPGGEHLTAYLNYASEIFDYMDAH